MQNDVSFPESIIAKYPFLKDIIEVSKADDPDQLIKALNFCIYKLKLIKDYEPILSESQWEKRDELLTTRVGEKLKKDVLRLGETLGIGASGVIKNAIEHYLYKDVPLPVKKEDGNTEKM